MIEYFDRDGLPITLRHWAQLLEEPKYSRVGFDEIGNVVVFTRWVGFELDDLGSGPFRTPMIFETLVFTPDAELGITRWATEADAVAGHQETVALVESFERGTHIEW